MHWVTSVEYVEGYKLRLSFEDGCTRIADLASHLTGEVFLPLKDLRLFKTARLNSDIDTVVWDNGADMSPDFLYDIGVPQKVATKKALKAAESRARYGRQR